MIYSIPYVLLIAFLGISAFIYDGAEDDTIKKRIVIISILVFFVFFGFRGFIFTDWISYYPYFEKCDIYKITDFELGNNKTLEPGFTLLMLFSKTLFNDFQFFVFLSTLIDLLLLLRFFRGRVDNIPLVLAFFLVFEGFMIVVNLMRNAIAILIFLNSLEYLEKRKPIQYFLLCFIALTFHTSSVFYFPLYFFFHKGYNRWIFLIIFCACNAIFLMHISVLRTIITVCGFGGEFLDKKIDTYIELSGSGFHISIGYIERLLTGMLVFCYYNKLKEIRRENTVFINALIGYFVAYFFFSEFSEISKRISTLFAFSYWIIWIDLIKCFYIRNNKILFVTFLSVYCLMKVVGLTCHPDMDYENVLLGNTKSFEERLYIHNKTFVNPDGS